MKLAEFGNALLRQSVAHPAFEVLARMQPFVRRDLERLRNRPMVAIFEFLEFHLVEHEILELAALIAGGPDPILSADRTAPDSLVKH